MRRGLSLGLVLVLLAALASAAQGQAPGSHPLARAKVGDFVMLEGALPNFTIQGDQKNATLKLRYTVVEKSAKEAKVKIQSISGDDVVSERVAAVPLDKPWAPELLLPHSDAGELPAATLDKKEPRQFMLYGQNFDCTLHTYRLKGSLFPKLVPNRPAKNEVVRIGFITHPTAPTLGLFAVSLDFGPKVTYQLKAGTGTKSFFKPGSKPGTP